MNADGLPLDQDTMRLLAEIGFMGTDAGAVVPARALFKALGQLRPDSTLPFIGLAMAALAESNAAEAVRVLREEGLKLRPADPDVMAFLGMALHAAGKDDEARKILFAVVAQDPSSNEAWVRMATKLLGTMQAHPSPASLMPRWGEQVRNAGRA